MRRRINIILCLREKGADIRMKDNDGVKPLSWAIDNGNIATVKLLEERSKSRTGSA